MTFCSTHATPLIDFQTDFTLSSNIDCVEKSNVMYYNVLDQQCDDKETVLSIINHLFNKFIVTKKQAKVFLEGDQLPYARIQSLKAEYESDLSWLSQEIGTFSRTTKRSWSKSTLLQA